MKKSLKKTDFIFIFVLFFFILFLNVFIFVYPSSHDESFYATIPFRLFNGDRLVQEEWHLTQFSSLFSYLPIHIWLKIKGSAESIIVFSRCIYLSIHTILTIVIYIFFRKYDLWAVVAAILFFTQSAIFSISYHSMFVVFFLLLTLCFISIYKNSSFLFFIFAGICYGSCCVCNPFFCVLYVIYLIIFTIFSRSVTYKEIILDMNNPKSMNNENTNHSSKSNSIFSFFKKYNCFFTQKAIINISIGILIMAVISISFYYFTGGKISFLFKNIKNIISNSDYNIISSLNFHLASKFSNLSYYLNKSSFNVFYIIPLFFIILFYDKNRNKDSRRFVYIFLSLFLAILYTCGMFYNNIFTENAIELPFVFFSIVCYILSNNKNKTLFYCMWLPCSIAALFHFFTANSHLLALNVLLIICNIAGVFFLCDLFREICPSKLNNYIKDKNILPYLNCSLLCLSLVLQILLHCFFYKYMLLPNENVKKATTGPYCGIYMTEEQYNNYSNAIADLDFIKERSNENSPILIASYNNWMYMYIERPIAVPTTWYLGEINQEQLTSYYKENPDKIPEYIYIDSLDYYNKVNNDQLNKNINISGKMFEFTKEELSNGVLLTVKKCKLNY